jgi:hypothetical protein
MPKNGRKMDISHDKKLRGADAAQMMDWDDAFPWKGSKQRGWQ